MNANLFPAGTSKTRILSLFAAQFVNQGERSATTLDGMLHDFVKFHVDPFNIPAAEQRLAWQDLRNGVKRLSKKAKRSMTKSSSHGPVVGFDNVALGLPPQSSPPVQRTLLLSLLCADDDVSCCTCPTRPYASETSVPSRSSAASGSAIDRTSMLWLSVISAHQPRCISFSAIGLSYAVSTRGAQMHAIAVISASTCLLLKNSRATRISVLCCLAGLAGGTEIATFQDPRTRISSPQTGRARLLRTLAATVVVAVFS
jgi:hypothetical protein